MFSHHLAKQGLLDSQNQPVTKEKMVKAISDFRTFFISLERPEQKILSCSVEGDGAIVTIQIEWTGIVDEKLPPLSNSGVSAVRLVKSQYGGWDVVQAIVPGWNASKDGGKSNDV